MKQKLIIVESPSKAKTIESYLNDGSIVMSSKGHIRDLATSGKGGLGIDVQSGFIPNYIVSKGKQSLVKELKQAAKKRDVLIATDQDREGEAIGWHLAQLLELDINEENRVVFTEITKNKILEAIQKPRKIDEGLVFSQETRRILDRIIGFKLSTLLQNKLKSKSAGRVQSVALKMIVDLEKEIKAFIPVTYYEIDAYFDEIKASHDHGSKKLDKKEAEAITKKLKQPFIVSEVSVKTHVRQPKAPYITSTLQQDASNHLGFKAKQTMQLAQKLYEGMTIHGEIKGLITYMRTDSTRVSDEFVTSASKYILDTYGKKYVGSYEAKVSEQAQDAHEAIRPTDIALTPQYVESHLNLQTLIKDNVVRDKSEFDRMIKLYERIYNRAVASLMSSATFEHTKVTLLSSDEPFIIEGKRLIFDGFTKVYDDVKSKDQLLKPYAKGDLLHSSHIEMVEKHTQPKARFTEAGLIKTLESEGIGRPSTYATVIQTILDRGYVIVEDKKFYPTEQGILTSDALEAYFSEIIDIPYTATLESHLDQIADGHIEKLDVLKEFYEKFEPMLDHAKTHMEKVGPKETGAMCPDCGGALVERKSRYGSFIACSNYPTCKYNNLEAKPKPEETGESCPVCSKPLVLRQSKKGPFIGCSGYPKCRHMASIETKETLKDPKTSS
jgi:DNA topoisomerase I